MKEDVAHGHGVDTGLASSLPRGYLPGARGADLIDILDLLQSDPFRLASGEVSHLGDDWLLCVLCHGERATRAV